ncbi:ImmA/IrrE family metallo-endopeptidase [Actinoplanes sp. NPDC049668]|uniref:ImmA/IrrE family metallo-endopeptidase n=1 Tax=unclassified Actinoplanes TaxID=2626549 RepID=UPI0033A81294
MAPTHLEQIKHDFDDRLAQLAASPQQWAEFLDQVAVFGAQYSLGNQILLLLQAEERGVTPRYFLPYGNAEGTTGWKAHARHVRRGEIAYQIWAPVRRRPTDAQARQWEAAGRTVRRDAHGKPAPQIVGFRLAGTFELGQTDGEPFEPPTVLRHRRTRTLPQLLTGEDPTHVYEDVVSLIRAHGYTFDLVPPGSPYLGAANGVTVPGPRQVLIRDDVDPAQRVKTTMHELAHLRCGHPEELDAAAKPHRGRRETEAESVAHIVCAALGLDTKDYSDAYVLGWADGDLNLIRDCAATVLRVAKQILTDLTPNSTGPDTGTASDDIHPADGRESIAGEGR